MLEIPENLKTLVSDYKMHLLQVRTSNFLKFQNTDINTVFDISRSIYNHDYRKINNLYHTQNISSELGMVIGAITESQQLIDHALDSELHGGKINMCTALEELRNEGIQEGEIRGTIKAYKKFHISYEDTLLNLMNEFSLSEEDAKKYLEQY